MKKGSSIRPPETCLHCARPPWEGRSCCKKHALEMRAANKRYRERHPDPRRVHR